MAKEIERKFLVTSDAWAAAVSSRKRIAQGYLATGDVTVRVRLIGETEARLTLKGKSTGAERDEFEYDIPLEDARALMAMASGSVVDKTRHLVPMGPLTWEIDVFDGANRGLVMAEIELASADQAFDRPPWLGREVTDDPRYFNAALAERPFETWDEPA